MPIYIFYKIYCKDENIKDCYVGSTNNLIRRWKDHKSYCNNENNKSYSLKVYQFIRENGGINNFDIIEIEKNECDDKNEAHLKERYWIEKLNANLNSNIPSRKMNEYNKIYYEKNIEIIKEYKKEWCENNKQRLKEYKKLWYENNKIKK